LPEIEETSEEDRQVQKFGAQFKNPRDNSDTDEQIPRKEKKNEKVIDYATYLRLKDKQRQEKLQQE